MEAAASSQDIWKNSYEEINSLLTQVKSSLDVIESMVSTAKVELPQLKVKTIRIKQTQTRPQKKKNYQVSGAPEEAQTLLEQIRITIELHHRPGKGIYPKVKRGRPESKIDGNPGKLKKLMNDWEKGLIKRLDKGQRSDAKFATVSRYIKKLPDIFLKYIGSKCQYKSKEIRVVLRAYLKSFLKGFISMFPCPDNLDYDELFYDYIILGFPETKVTKILDDLAAEGSMSKEVHEKKIEQVRIRIKASKFSYKDLFISNVGFQVIANNLIQHLKLIKGKHKEDVKSVVDYLHSLELNQ